MYESHHGQYKVNLLFCVHCHMPNLAMNCGGAVMPLMSSGVPVPEMAEVKREE